MAPARLSDSWERGDPYEQYVGRWSRQVAPRFLSWLAVPAGRRCLDVGCGTGALCAAIANHSSPSLVVGVEPSEGFLHQAKAQLAGRARLYRGSASEVPLGTASVDVAVSGLLLNIGRRRRLPTYSGARDCMRSTSRPSTYGPALRTSMTTGARSWVATDPRQHTPCRSTRPRGAHLRDLVGSACPWRRMVRFR